MSASAPWCEESLRACPVCAAAERGLLHEGLADVSFGAVKGRWTLWRCACCRSAYLDPRPDRGSIGQAYARYYTHGEASSSAAPPLSWRGRLRTRCEQAYLHRRYGLSLPAGSHGRTLEALVHAALLPYRQSSDARMRHLPGPGRGRALLDVGCGDGAFLHLARACGWVVQGLEPDPVAAAAARQRGLSVHCGGLDTLAGQTSCVDLITLSHVIEHLHDPATALADCRRLLKPGGTLWLSTPNLDAAGHQRFGRHWRGLEAPRHLVLFTASGLERLLAEAGFGRIQRLPSAWDEPAMLARASRGLAQGLPPRAIAPPLQAAEQRWARWTALRAWLQPSLREFIYLRAER
jgi:SAM-dependent methyltransferase